MTLRVVHYHWCAEIGGIERLLLDLASAQHEKGGVDITVLLGRMRGRLLDRYRSLPVRLESADLQSGRDLSPRRLKRLTNRFRDCDVLHMHAFHPLVALAAKRSGVPTVFTEHGAFGLGRKRGLADLAKRFLKGRFINGAVRFVTFNSRHTRRTARGIFGLERTPQAVVYNGTRIRNAPPDLHGLDPELRHRCVGRFVVGTVGRFTRPKRIDRLVEGFAMLERREDALLLLVGDGPEREPLRELAARFGVADSVVFTGYRTNVAAYQDLMDVCVVPSEVEAFGLAAIEALALGKPAIVFHDGGGMAEVVEQHEPRDVVWTVAQLARRLEDYRAGAADPDIHRNYARRFDIARTAEHFTGIYRHLSGGCA